MMAVGLMMMVLQVFFVLLMLIIPFTIPAVVFAVLNWALSVSHGIAVHIYSEKIDKNQTYPLPTR